MDVWVKTAFATVALGLGAAAYLRRRTCSPFRSHQRRPRVHFRDGLFEVGAFKALDDNNDMLPLIFSWLSAEGLCRCACTSRLWRQLLLPGGSHGGGTWKALAQRRINGLRVARLHDEAVAEAKDIPVNPACDVRRYYAAAFKLICTGRESLHQGALEYGYKMLVAGIAFFAIVEATHPHATNDPLLFLQEDHYPDPLPVNLDLHIDRLVERGVRRRFLELFSRVKNLDLPRTERRLVQSYIEQEATAEEPAAIH